jgi:aspartate kinase
VPGIAYKIFGKLAAENINVDIILQSVGRNDTKDITFTVSGDNAEKALEVLGNLEIISSLKIECDSENVAKVSAVGAGMETHPGVAATMFKALFEADINIQMISTSEIKISVLIDKKDADAAVAAIHDAFIPEQ